MDGDDWELAADLWEHQGKRLRVRDLASALNGVPGDLPVSVEIPDGFGGVKRALVTTVELTGDRDGPSGVSVIVVPEVER